jgi:putative transcriptional regulator
MHKFKILPKSKVKRLSSKEIREIRLKENISQPIFAEFLNVSSSTVEKWEIGQRVPIGASLQLLHIAKHYGLKIFNKKK